MSHEQVWTKVNAPVDRDVERLIRALSQFPRLQTVESCQGGGDRSAWVCFVYGDYSEGKWQDLSDFVLGYFGIELVHSVGDLANVSINITEAGTIRGELSVRPGAIDRVASAIEALAR